MVFSPVYTNLKCFHCGDVASTSRVVYEEKVFCCEGCKSVYSILKDHDLGAFYKIGSGAGTSPKTSKKVEEFAFLDQEEITAKLVDYTSENLCKVSFMAPAIHCSSCIWLLENLYKLHAGVLSAEVNFIEKRIHISYNPTLISLKELVCLLSNIGYEPEITLGSVMQDVRINKDRSLWYKLGVAGFAFGNIMLFSLPAYFGLEGEGGEKDFDVLFKIINLVLSLPVLLYSASGFLGSAYKSLRNRHINLDVPLCIGILALYGTSLYEIFSGNGPGYLDSFAALIFFLLAGRALQKLSFDKLRFDRDSASYFPLSVVKLDQGKETYIPITSLHVGDHILIRHNEMIPADGHLVDGVAYIDYSFVTGEALPVHKSKSEILYAGGRQVGGAVELCVQKKPSQSYLVQLWNSQQFEKHSEEDYESVVNKRSKYFTYAVLGVAFAACAYWTYADSLAKGVLVMATTLNVSCPCALAVAIPFTYANIIRHLARKKFYLKNSQIVEGISAVDTIVFDKTGTLTDPESALITYSGESLTITELQILRSGLRQSIHPLSTLLYKHIDVPIVENVRSTEHISQGLSIEQQHTHIKVGSYDFVGGSQPLRDSLSTSVYVSVNSDVKGKYVFNNKYIADLGTMIDALQRCDYKLHVLSGDNTSESKALSSVFQGRGKVLFNQKPEDKLNYITKLQSHAHKVMMVGDGLNDAAALKQSNVGVAVVHDNTQFSPSSDAILSASHIHELPSFVKYCKSGMDVIRASFICSSLYNAIGLSFAVQGLFSPVFAAILMPVSSVSVVLFSVLMTNRKAAKILKS